MRVIHSFVLRRLSFVVELFVLVLIGGMACHDKSQLLPESHSPTDYWTRPIPLQGQPPQSWTILEQSLLPKDCGTCHRAQLDDWQGALHSKAVGPGLIGQLLEQDDPGFTRSCYKCHAPMIEQHAKIEVGDGNWVDNEFYDDKLHQAGVGCPVCHVRGSRIHGPPPRAGTQPSGNSQPHSGYLASERFQSSEFCAMCHQFPSDWPSLNGKLLQNTFEEWKDSPAAKRGQTCQDCHMPGRRHLFRGIHDPAMTRSAFELTTSTTIAANGKILANASLKNVGAGHMAPTYVTPRIEITFKQIDANGDVVGEISPATVIQRQVILSGESHEVSDTRLAPGKSIDTSWETTKERTAISVRTEVRCIPDQFYEEFYKRLLTHYEQGSKSYQLIQLALRDAEARRFVVFKRDHAL